MVAITVSDPKMEQADSRHSFTSYLVSTKEGNSVRHRYSDFQWLYQRLQTEFPGAIIPIIPHTRTIMSSKKFNIEFIEDRRRDLEEFLHAIAEHEELCRAPSMTPFMLHPIGPDFDEGKKGVEQTVPTDSDVIKWAEEDTQSEIGGSGSSTSKSQPSPPVTARKTISNFFAKIRLSAGNQELMTTNDESQVIALHDYVTEVHGHTNTLMKASDALVKSTLNTADANHEIGVPIGLWKTTYTFKNLKQDEDVKDMMAGICQFSDELSSLLRKKHQEEEILFGRKIHKLANAVSAFDIALKKRKNYQMEFTHTHNKMIEKNAALEKAQKTLKPPEVTDKLNNERVELQSRIEFERKRFEEVTQRLLKDAEKNKPKLLKMLQCAFLEYTKVQISFTSQIDEACRRLMPTLEETEASQLPLSTSLDSSTNGDNIIACTENDGRASAPPAPPPAAPPPPPRDEEGVTIDDSQ
jgi:hypothetical protein